MTSVLRSLSVRKEGLTQFVKVESPSYNDSIKGINVLFPFVYSNGVLDISYAGNAFKVDMVDTVNQSPSDIDVDIVYRITGSSRLVTSLGDNFKAYIRAWRDGTIDTGSSIQLYTPSQVIRVQGGDHDHIDDQQNETYKISTKQPSNDFYVTGESANEYESTYIFKTPLTFTIVESGVTQYITFRSMLDQE